MEALYSLFPKYAQHDSSIHQLDNAIQTLGDIFEVKEVETEFLVVLTPAANVYVTREYGKTKAACIQAYIGERTPDANLINKAAACFRGRYKKALSLVAARQLLQSQGVCDKPEYAEKLALETTVFVGKSIHGRYRFSISKLVLVSFIEHRGAIDTKRRKYDLIEPTANEDDKVSDMDDAQTDYNNYRVEADFQPSTASSSILYLSQLSVDGVDWTVYLEIFQRVYSINMCDDDKKRMGELIAEYHNGKLSI